MDLGLPDAILTTRLAESVDGLDSSLAQSPDEL